MGSKQSRGAARTKPSQLEEGVQPGPAAGQVMLVVRLPLPDPLFLEAFPVRKWTDDLRKQDTLRHFIVMDQQASTTEPPRPVDPTRLEALGTALAEALVDSGALARDEFDCIDLRFCPAAVCPRSGVCEHNTTDRPSPDPCIPAAPQHVRGRPPVDHPVFPASPAAPLDPAPSRGFGRRAPLSPRRFLWTTDGPGPTYQRGLVKEGRVADVYDDVAGVVERWPTLQVLGLNAATAEWIAGAAQRWRDSLGADATFVLPPSVSDLQLWDHDHLVSELDADDRFDDVFHALFRIVDGQRRASLTVNLRPMPTREPGPTPVNAPRPPRWRRLLPCAQSDGRFTWSTHGYDRLYVLAPPPTQPHHRPGRWFL